MGNTSASQKDRSASAPRAAKDLNDLLPALRERFEELAGFPAAPAVPAPGPAPAESRADEASAQRRKQQQQQQQHQQHLLQEGSAAAPPTAPPPAAPAAPAAAAPAAAAAAAGDGREQEERYVMLDDWSELPGPRGAQLAKRLYGVLDANGDGKLDFEEFASAACLLKGSPDEDKLALLFKMYGDGDGAVTGSKAGLVGRRGLMAFILDIIAASPPLLAPPDLSAVAVNGGGGGGGGRGGGGDNTPLSSASSLSPQEGGGQGRVHVVAAAAGAPTPPAVDLEMELEGVLAKMAGVVLAEFDADNDGLLTEKEWRAYVKREEETVSAFLKTLSDSVEKLLLPWSVFQKI